MNTFTAATHFTMSRRGFVQGMSLSALALGGSGLLAACGTEGAKVKADECKTTDKSETEKEITFANWDDYIDPVKGKSVSTLEKFEQQTGIAVDYLNADVEDNQTFYAKVAPQLKACKSTKRDVFALTDWMAAKMIDLGWLQKLDHANMPNVDANLLDSLKSPSWDPNRDYSVPWQSGMTGICYNSELTDPVTSFEELITRPDLNGKIALLTELPDTMLFMLLLQGADPSDFTTDEFDAAIAELQKVVDAGQVRKFTGNDYLQELTNENIAACEAWSGDIPQLGDEKFVWVAPEEGLSLWSDNLLVPNQGEHKANVEELINFYYDPTNAAQLAAYIYYFCPVKGAQQEIAQFDDTAVNNPLIFPDEAMLSNGHLFMALDAKQDQDFHKKFTAVMGG